MPYLRKCVDTLYRAEESAKRAFHLSEETQMNVMLVVIDSFVWITWAAMPTATPRVMAARR